MIRSECNGILRFVRDVIESSEDPRRKPRSELLTQGCTLLLLVSFFKADSKFLLRKRPNQKIFARNWSKAAKEM